MELQCFRMMWIVFVVVITAVLTENVWKKNPNAGNVNDNTMPKEKGIFKFPSSPKGTKTSTKTQAGTNMVPTTDNEQNKKNYSTVNMIYPTNNLTAFSHDRDNSEQIRIIVGLAVSLFIAVVAGLLFLYCYKRLPCFKGKPKGDLEMSSIPMLITNINTPNEHVDEDNVLKDEVEKINMPDTDTTEDEVDISVANTNSLVFVDEYTSKFNNIQPTDARE